MKLNHPKNSPVTIRSIGGGYFQVDIGKKHAGHRIQKGFTTLADAKAFAEQVWRELRREGQAFLDLSAAEKHLCAEATRVLRPHNVDVLKAARFYLERHPRGDDKTVREVVDQLLASKRADRMSDRHVDGLRSGLNRFCEAGFGDRALRTIRGKEEIGAWLDSLAQEGLCGLSRRHYRGKIVMLFRFARDKGLIPEDCREDERVPRVKAKNTTPIGIFTPEELTTLLGNANQDLLPCFCVAAFTPVRNAELLRMEWGHIKLERGIIEIPAGNAKTAQRRVIDIPDNLKEWLKPYAHRTGRVWPRTFTAYNMAQRRCVKKAGIAWKANGLRHSIISYLVARDQNVDKVALQAGNSAAMIFQHYRELVSPGDARRWFAISPASPSNLVPMPTVATA